MTNFFVKTVCVLAMFAPGMALAASNTPLMVVRYNQPKVFYQKQAYNAISRAVAIKPSVMFDVVSFVPASANTEKSDQETNGFVNTLTSMGIPQQRIHVEKQSVDDSRVHEIYLYVD